MAPLLRHSTESEITWTLAMWIFPAGPSVGIHPLVIHEDQTIQVSTVVSKTGYGYEKSGRTCVATNPFSLQT